MHSLRYYYLAQPYYGTELEIKQRVTIAHEVCFKFLQQGVPVFSPLAHNHAIIEQAPPLTSEQRRDIFLTFDFVMLRSAAAMIVLKIPGWKQSHGLQCELEFCVKQDIPVLYVEEDLEISSEFIAQLA